LTIEEYFYYLTKSRGLFLWQQYFTSKEDLPEYVVDQFFENINEIFPGTDLSDFPKTDRPYMNYKINMLESPVYYKKLFENVKTRIECANVEIQLTEFEIIRYIESNSWPQQFYYAYIALGFGLPDDFVKYYQDMEYVKMAWASQTFVAHFHFHSIDEIFKSGQSIIGVYHESWDYNAYSYFHEKELNDFVNYGIGDNAGKPLEKKDLEKWRIFYVGEEEMAIVNFISKEKYGLAYICEGKFFPLNISFTHFIDCLLATCGVKRWPVLLLEDPLKSMGIDPHDLFAKIKSVFPNVAFPEILDRWGK
jgi:hypothetical protein